MHLFRYFLIAGAVDGMVFSVILVPLLSQKFQGVVVGVLGGMGLESVGGQNTTLKRGLAAVAESIHEVIDTGQKLLYGGLTPHAYLEQAVRCALFTMIFVVVASLVAHWAMGSLRAKVTLAPA